MGNEIEEVGQEFPGSETKYLEIPTAIVGSSRSPSLKGLTVYLWGKDSGNDNSAFLDVN